MVRTGTRWHQVGVHVTGDRAIDTVADAIIAAQHAHPREDPRHYLIHGDFISEANLKRWPRHGIGVNMNPTIKWTIADLEVGVVGTERAAYEWPYRSAVESGVHLMSSSDAPVTPPDWRQGISTMILRESKASGAVSGPISASGLEHAFRTYTINAAWQDFAEDWKGSSRWARSPTCASSTAISRRSTRTTCPPCTSPSPWWTDTSSTMPCPAQSSTSGLGLKDLSPPYEEAHPGAVHVGLLADVGPSSGEMGRDGSRLANDARPWKLDEAVEKANALDVGLGASVWSSNLRGGLRGRRPHPGGHCLDQQTRRSQPRIPFGGAKQSGYGLEFGVEGLKHLGVPQVING